MPITLLVASTIELAGKLMIAYTAVQVHYRVWKEHKIDEQVFQEMQRERKIGVIGMVLMVIGYTIEVGFTFLK